MRLTSLLFVTLVAGCATSIHAERESLLADPIDCASAETDIAALEAAMPSRRERARSAIQSVTPVGVVSGVATGTYGDRTAVLTGRTEEELTARIDDIKQSCGLTENRDTTNPNSS
ncbi:MAG: hypothetical protein AAFO74_16570 [Pseudomonadota bacterium]